MKIEFPVLIGLNGGHGDGGDSFVEIELTDEEYDRLVYAAKHSEGEWLEDAEDIADIEEKACDEFRDQQLCFISEDFLQEIAEENDVDRYDLTDEQIWEGFCDRYSFSICFPEDLLDEEEEDEDKECK